MQIQKPVYPTSLIAYIAALLLLALVIANLPRHGWVHNEPDDNNGSNAVQSLAADPEPVAPSQLDEGPAQRKGKCDECGVIVSMASVAGLGYAPAGFEVAVRLNDKSIRLLNFASTANWRVGEHIILLGGEN